MDFKPTKWQRLVLIGMYAVACKAQDPTRVWFPRRALMHITWSDWHGSHTKRMNELIENKWVKKGKTENGLIAYRLTPASHGALSVDIGNTIANVHYDPQADEMFAGWGTQT